MEIFAQVFEAAISIMKIPFTIYGHTLTLWNVFGFGFFVGGAVMLWRGVFFRD